MKIKFMYNGIKIDGKLYKAFYSFGGFNTPEDKETITIYRKGYDRTPAIEGLFCENKTDIQTDYIEEDLIRVRTSNKHYQDVLAAFKKQDAKRIERGNKLALKYPGLYKKVEA